MTATYRQPVSLFWWLHRRSYLLFVLRELSAVAVAWFVVYLLWLVTAIGSGSAAYQRFLDMSGTPLLLVINAVALAFLLVHSVTWLWLAPRAMVIRRVPPTAVLIVHYLAWIVVSAAVAWVILR